MRRAEPRDLATVGEVTVAAYSDLIGLAEQGYADKLRDAAARYREAELWVAVDESDTVLGTVTLVHDGSPWREIAVGAEGEFRMLAVAPEGRGRGVGERLVRLCLDRFASLGAPRVVLSTQPRMAAARRLYERLGFERAPDLDWSQLPGVDLIAYRLELP